MSGQREQITTHQSSKQASRNIVTLHPVAWDYQKQRQAERRILRQIQREAAKPPMVGYVLLALILYGTAFFVGSEVIRLLAQ